jgi:hypothetical protein
MEINLLERLNVFLRDDRNYIQGTQIIARTVDVLGYKDWSLEKAIFTRITNKLVYVSKIQIESKSHALLGEADFYLGNKKQTIYYYESSEVAVRQKKVMPIQISDISLINKESFSIHFLAVPTFENILNVIVQSLKKANAYLSPDSYDLWWTGFRKLALECNSIDDNTEEVSGNITLKLIRTIAKDMQCQTLWLTSINYEQYSKEGYATFTYKRRQS